MKNNNNENLWPAAVANIVHNICVLAAIYFMASCVAGGPLLP